MLLHIVVIIIHTTVLMIKMFWIFNKNVIFKYCPYYFFKKIVIINTTIIRLYNDNINFHIIAFYINKHMQNNACKYTSYLLLKKNLLCI